MEKQRCGGEIDAEGRETSRRGAREGKRKDSHEGEMDVEERKTEVK